MTFICRQCGKCCMSLGDYIVIERELGPYTFACESVSTGTTFVAEVDEDKRQLFADSSFTDKNPSACRFLRQDCNLVRCTIHRDSPAQCKFYRCVVMRIFDPAGKPVGYVTGTLALHSDDTEIRAVWEEAERRRPKADEGAELWLGNFLQVKGYRVE